jgi:hypothetical protein
MNVIGEEQNGFRRNRRAEENISQSKKIAKICTDYRGLTRIS